MSKLTAEEVARATWGAGWYKTRRHLIDHDRPCRLDHSRHVFYAPTRCSRHTFAYYFDVDPAVEVAALPVCGHCAKFVAGVA